MSDSEVSSTAIVSACDLQKVYRRGREDVQALRGISFEINCGEFVAILGPSGSGKTTLLNLLGCMDSPTSGTLKIGGREVQRFTEAERTGFRRDQIGFVFQHFGLLPTLNVAENVALPLLFSRRNAAQEIDELLKRVELNHRRDHLPRELSGGEMQRVAIARALINHPAVLLADEPTGNLDSVTGDSVIRLFQQLNAGGLTTIVVTHNASLAAVAHRQISLRDGLLVA